MVGITIPITVGGWILTFGVSPTAREASIGSLTLPRQGLQAYAMAPNGAQLRMFKPKILNGILIGAGGVLLFAQTVRHTSQLHGNLLMLRSTVRGCLHRARE